MKVALTSSGRDLSAPLDLRFGRAAGFLVVDTDTGETTYESNEQNLNAAQGAGIQTAQNVAATGAKAVISGHCGPKAFRILSASNIAVYPCSAATVGEALERYKAGKLTAADGADVEGHWV
jgi:predicted Fe-Mo cluster-binding NifX family protein